MIAPNRYYRVKTGDDAFYAEPAVAGSAVPYPDDRQLRLLVGDPIAGATPTDEIVERDEVDLLVPCEPTKIIGVARNFAAHAAERERAVPGEPLVFVKPLTTLVPTGAGIVRPPACQLLNYEGEMAVVIGQGGKDILEAEAMDHVFGYTVINDVTARDIQNREENFVRAKGYDTFAPVGPCVATGLDPGELEVETRVNGELCQQGAIRDLVHPIPELIAFISGIMTLLPGDLIATGTPRGMRPIEPGDVVEVAVTRIGKISNPVVAPAS